MSSVCVCSVETLTDVIVRGIRKSKCHELRYTHTHTIVVVARTVLASPVACPPIGSGTEREGLCQLAMLMATQLGEESKGMVGALQPLLLTLAKDPGVKLTERTMVCAVVSTLTLSSLCASVVVCV